MNEVVYVARLGRVGFEQVQQMQKTYTEQLRRGLRHSLLLLLEHEAVYTYGQRRGAQTQPDPLHSQGVPTVAAARGGDVTFHGPGQLVAYPLLDLKTLRRADLRRYVDDLEETLIRTCAALGLPHATRHPKHTGVWVSTATATATATAATTATATTTATPSEQHMRKIGFVGIHVSSWITSQGISLNRTAEPLPYFRAIVPCGIHGCPVTSLEQELLDEPRHTASAPARPPRWTEHNTQAAFVAAFQSVFSVHTCELQTPVLWDLHHTADSYKVDPTFRRVPVDRTDVSA